MNFFRSPGPLGLNKVQNKGTQGVRARYGAELPPIISVPDKNLLKTTQGNGFFMRSSENEFFQSPGPLGACRGLRVGPSKLLTSCLNLNLPKKSPIPCFTSFSGKRGT